MLAQELEKFRQKSNKLFVFYGWAHVPVIGLVAWQGDKPWAAIALAAALLQALVTSLWATHHASVLVRHANALSLVCMASLIVFSSPAQWQIDYHMYYFAVFAMLVAYCDWKVLLLAATLTALHHLTLNFLYPHAVFPDGSDFGRVVLHAIVVIIEVAVLIWVSFSLMHLFSFSAEEQIRKRADQMAKDQHTQNLLLEEKAKAEKNAAISSILHQLEDSVKGVITQLNLSTERLAVLSGNLLSATEHTEKSTQEISHSANAAEHMVDMIASATEEVSTSISDINRLMGNTRQRVEEAASHVGVAQNKIDYLNEISSRISGILTAIISISENINLLALNATIEAARAGEMGKGFAVVAVEVKNLANQANMSVESISSQIKDMQHASKEAVEAVSRIRRAMENVTQNAADTAKAVEQQHDANLEISRNIQNVLISTKQSSQAVRGIVDIAATTGKSARDVQQSAATIAKDSKSLKEALQHFIGQMQGNN